MEGSKPRSLHVLRVATNGASAANAATVASPANAANAANAANTGAGIAPALVACLLAAGVSAQEATPVPEPAPTVQAARAELDAAAQLAATDAESAAARVRRGLLLCERIADAKTRGQVAAELTKLQGKIDPHGARVAKLEARAAKDFRELATVYLAEGWHATAERLLAVVESFAPELVEWQLAEARSKRGDRPVALQRALLREWFAGGTKVWSKRDWTFEGDDLVAPKAPADMDSSLLVGTGRMPRAGRLRCELQLCESGCIGFAFDLAGEADALAFHDLEFDRHDGAYGLLGYHVQPNADVPPTDWKVEVLLRPEALRGYVPVEITFTESAFYLRAGAAGPVLCVPRPRFGDDRLGMFLSGNIDATKGIRVRGLQVEALQRGPAPAAPSSSAHQLGDPAVAARAALDGAAAIAGADPEGAAARLRFGWRACEAVQDRAQQQKLREGLTKALGNLDSRGMRCARAELQFVTEAREAARLYAGAKWLATAERLLAAADVLAPELASQQLSSVRALQAGNRTAAKDPLRAWFADGEKPLADDAWTFERDALLAPKHEPRPKADLLMSADRLPRAGVLRCEIQLPEDGRLGFCFDVGPFEGSLKLDVVEFQRKPGQVELAANSWSPVGRISKPSRAAHAIADPAALAGWVPVEIVFGETMLTARAGGGVAVVAMARTRRGDDRLGLFVAPDVDANVPARLRKLEILPFGPPEGAR